MIFLYIALLMLAFTFNINSAEYREIPLKDKIKNKDLSFCVTFDNRDMNA